MAPWEFEILPAPSLHLTKPSAHTLALTPVSPSNSDASQVLLPHAPLPTFPSIRLLYFPLWNVRRGTSASTIYFWQMKKKNMQSQTGLRVKIILSDFNSIWRMSPGLIFSFSFFFLFAPLRKVVPWRRQRRQVAGGGGWWVCWWGRSGTSSTRWTMTSPPALSSLWDNSGPLFFSFFPLFFFGKSLK